MAKKKKKAAKKKAKAKQPTKAELEQMRLDYDRELQEEKDLLAELDQHEKNIQGTLWVGEQPKIPIVKNYLTLIRMFKRKHLEAAELKSHLVGIKEFLVECWDEEEEHFDASYARDFDRPVSGHWCPGMIEEIGEMVEEGAVYASLPIGSVF